MEKYSEKLLEKKLRERCKDYGALALKFTSSTYTGLPDRLILLPDRTVLWVEVKTTGQKLSPEQATRKKMLERRGHTVYVVDDLDSLALVLVEVKEYAMRYRETQYLGGRRG